MKCTSIQCLSCNHYICCTTDIKLRSPGTWFM